jgi:acetyl-CoA acyltransferase
MSCPSNWRKPLPEAVIVSALRTPIGTARNGTLRDTSTFDLAHHLVGATVVAIEVPAH